MADPAAAVDPAAAAPAAAAPAAGATDNFVSPTESEFLFDDEGNVVLDEDGNPKRKPPPPKPVKARDPFADLAYERARLRTNEIKMLLFHAVKTGNESELVRILDTDTDADINVRNCSGATLLHVASAQGSSTVMELILARQQPDLPLINVKENAESGGFTALHHAVICGHQRVTDMLLKAGADMNAQDEDGLTPLHHAARRGNGKMVEVLLGNGANPEKTDKDGKPPAYVARIFKHDHIVAMLPKEEKPYDYQSWLCNEIENNEIVAKNRIVFAANKKKKGKKGKKKK